MRRIMKTLNFNKLVHLTVFLNLKSNKNCDVMNAYLSIKSKICTDRE